MTKSRPFKVLKLIKIKRKIEGLLPERPEQFEHSLLRWGSGGVDPPIPNRPIVAPKGASPFQFGLSLVHLLETQATAQLLPEV